MWITGQEAWYHASNILLKNVNNRLQSKADIFIGKIQFGFRKGCGTREAIGVMQTICECSLEHGNEVSYVLLILVRPLIG